MRRQLALTTLAISSLIVVAFLVPLGLLVRGIAEDRALDAAERSAAALVPTLALDVDSEALEPTVDAMTASGVGEVSVVRADGEVVGAALADDTGDDTGDDIDAARGGRAFTTAAPDGGTAVYVPALLPDGSVDVIRIAVPPDRLHEGVRTSWLLLGLLGVALLIVAMVVADRLARRIVAPVGALAAAAHRLGEGDLDARVDPDGPTEVAEVGRTLNQLAERIEELLVAERESVADLSHRLRTPVTALRLDVEALPHGDERERLSRDVAGLTAAVDALIADARRTQRRRAHPAERPSSDLCAITADRVAFWGLLADEEARPHSLRAPDGPCPVAVADDELAAALDVLLGNVMSHTPEGTPFTVTVERLDRGARVVLDDEGPGFPTSVDPTRRGESGAGSTGLGLDIAAGTAERSGGRLAVGSSPGGGARVTLELGGVDEA